MNRPLRLLSLCALLLLAACGGERAYHRDERFDTDLRRHDYAATKAALCTAAQHVLVAQGYWLNRREDGADTVLMGQKEFKEKTSGHSVLQVQAVCSDKGKGSALFVTALESRFDVAVATEKTGVGLPLVSPLSVSSTSTSENQLKRSGETVNERGFYEALFKAVERELAGK
ncbi:hypothetical protein DLREEDagrD3_28290 [Denitratisoma sp. agr-D3]